MQEISIIPVVCLSNFGENIGRVDHEPVHLLTEHSFFMDYLIFGKIKPKKFRENVYTTYFVSRHSVENFHWLNFRKISWNWRSGSPWSDFVCNVSKTPLRSIAKYRQINTILSGGLRFVFLSGFSSVCEQWIRLLWNNVHIL